MPERYGNWNSVFARFTRSFALWFERSATLHAPEVECIGQGKAHRPYEFGVKVSVATTVKHSAGGQFVTYLAAARLRHIAGTTWSTKCYMNMRLHAALLRNRSRRLIKQRIAAKANATKFRAGEAQRSRSGHRRFYPTYPHIEQRDKPPTDHPPEKPTKVVRRSSYFAAFPSRMRYLKDPLVLLI
jgi:hypothetical protein